MFVTSSSEFQLRIDHSFIEELTSQQVSYLHELNRILAENRDKTIVYDIVENSNLLQCLDPHLIERLYELNPEVKNIQYPSAGKGSGKGKKK